MIEKMPTFSSLQVAMALVPVQVTVADSMILEGAIKEATNDTEPFLRRLFRLQLVLLDTTFRLELCADLAHLEAKVSRCNLRLS